MACQRPPERFALARVATPAPELLTPCAGVADELADVWSAARRAELAASFTASGVAYAQGRVPIW